METVWHWHKLSSVLLTSGGYVCPTASNIFFKAEGRGTDMYYVPSCHNIEEALWFWKESNTSNWVGGVEERKWESADVTAFREPEARSEEAQNKKTTLQQGLVNILVGHNWSIVAGINQSILVLQRAEFFLSSCQAYRNVSGSCR